jgi:hypothetical protein
VTANSADFVLPRHPGTTSFRNATTRHGVHTTIAYGHLRAHCAVWVLHRPILYGWFIPMSVLLTDVSKLGWQAHELPPALPVSALVQDSHQGHADESIAK